jgi:hypothetical protein
MGSNASNSAAGYGIATSSSKGATWNRAASPISVKANGCDLSLSFWPVMVLVVEGPKQYRLFFSEDKLYCTALSTDGGVTWPASTIQPMQGIDVGNSLQSAWKEGSVYKLYYGTRGMPQAGLGYATSTDAVNWTRSPSNPVGSAGVPISMVWDPTQNVYQGLTASFKHTTRN